MKNTAITTSLSLQDADVVLRREQEYLAVPQTQDALALAGQAANRFAKANIFKAYQKEKAENTLRRQRADLRLFQKYLKDAGVTVENLYSKPEAWKGATWGLIRGFEIWMSGKGYSIGSINVRLSTVRQYAHLASLAGFIEKEEADLISSVNGYSYRAGREADNKRRTEKIVTRRVGAKKEKWNTLSELQAQQLKQQPTDEENPETPQTRRDRLLMCLLLDHGLRCGEMALLETSRFNISTGMFEFYRPKISIWQIHRMTTDTLAAAHAYMIIDGISSELLLRPSLKSGQLAPGTSGMSAQGITGRVKVLGVKIGISNLSAHDCRHYWVTQALSLGTHIDRLQQAGGWASPVMPLRYASAAVVANEGVKTS